MEQARQRRQAIREASRYADVLVELTRLTFHKPLPTIALGASGLAGTSILLALRFHDLWLWVFAALILCVGLLRMATALLFHRRTRDHLSIRGAFRWQFAYFFVTVGNALILALSTVYDFHLHDSTASILSTVAVFLLGIGLVGRVGLYPWMVVTSGFIVLAGLAAGTLLLRDPLARFVLILIILYGYGLYESTQKQFQALVEQLRSRRSLRLLAETDPLTRLANRRIFEDRLASLCVAEAPFAILFMDLDHFKAVNDTYGHLIGDILLQRVAVRLRASIRKGDLVARIGGDEFAVLQASGATQQSAEALARRINRAIAAPFEIEGLEITLGTSIGIRLSNRDCVDPADIFAKADQALYLAKQAGGGRFATSETEPDQPEN